MVIEAPGRLPGGIRPWLGWLVLVSRPREFGAAVVRLAVTASFAVGMAMAFGPWTGMLLGLVVVVLFVVARVLRRPGVKATELSQPALAALVADVATHAGVPAPDRVWLTGDARVAGVATGWRRDLVVGEPLLACLATAEVRALVAHELALLHERRRWLVLRLLRRFEEAEMLWGDEEIRPRLVDRDLAVLAPLAAEVHRRADAMAPPDVLARAVALAKLAAYEHLQFRRQYLPYIPWGETGKAGMRDLHEGWQSMTGYGVVSNPWGPGLADMLTHIHAALAAPLGALGQGLLPLRRAVDVVHYGPLTRWQRRRLLTRQAFGRRLRWTTFEQAPPHWWVERATEGASRLRRGARALLDRDPADDLETARLIFTRPAALGKAIFGPALWSEYGGESEEPVDQDALAALVENFRPLVEDALFALGWRLEHPAVRGVMRGAAGERVDAAELVTGPIADPDLNAFAELLARP